MSIYLYIFYLFIFFHSAECHMVIVKHEMHHLHDFMIKCVIFHVNQVNFDQEQCTLALIQREWCSKNRLGRNDPGTASSALLLQCVAACGVNALISYHGHRKKYALLTQCLRVRCETGLKLWEKSILHLFLFLLPPTPIVSLIPKPFTLLVIFVICFIIAQVRVLFTVK